MLKSIAAALLIVGLPATALLAADATNPPQQQNAPAAEAPAPGGGEAAAGGSQTETARNAEKGSLKIPYADFAKVAEEGHQKFMAAGCNGCHGGTGGGHGPTPHQSGLGLR